MKLGRQYRVFGVGKDDIDVEKRTVALSFSSETPVRRGYGDEVLDHGDGSVRLGRLKDGGPLLVNHDFDRHVGVVEDVRIESRTGRAVVRFGKSPYADEVFNDVVDGIRRSISVGYDIFEFVLEKREGDVDTYRAMDWEPYELSFVPAGADPTVGVGRDAQAATEHTVRIKSTDQPQIEERTMPPEMTPEERAAQERNKQALDAATTAATTDARTKELARVRELSAIGEQFSCRDKANEFIQAGKDPGDLRIYVLEEMAKRGNVHVRPVGTGDGTVDLSESDVRRFSFCRALTALANPQDKRAQEAAAFEREVSNAAVAAQKSETKGFRIPMELLTRGLLDMEDSKGIERAIRSSRALNVSTFTQGGAFVGTDLLTSSFIDLLRHANVLEKVGAMTLTGLVGHVAIPRQTGGATVYWLSPEGGNPAAASIQAVDQVGLTPKTLGAFTDFTRQLLLQSSIDVEAFVRMDLAKQLGLELSRVAIYGLGTDGQPRGIFNTTGINTQHFAAANVGGVAQPVWGEIVAMESALAASDVVFTNPAYVLSTKERGYMKTTPKVGATFPLFIWDPDNEVNGYPTAVSNQISDADIFYGNWSDLIIGMWGGFDLLIDPFTGGQAGTIRAIVHQSCDVAVRHPVSFCLGSNTDA